MKKDTIIFDLDGTLLNTLDGLTESFNYTISKFGYEERTKDEIRQFVGNGVLEAINRCVNYKLEEDKQIEALEIFKIYYRKNMKNLSYPYEGIIDLLNFLKEKNYHLAVVSNKYDSAVKSLCNFYFGNTFELTLGESSKIRRKPKPDGILEVINYFSSEKGKTVYIGDSEVDVVTAKNASVDIISVLWGYRSKEALKKSGANCFVKTPLDILKILENND